MWKKVLSVGGQNCSLCAWKVTSCEMRSRVTCIITGCTLYYFTKSIFLQDTRFLQQWFWGFWSSGFLHCVAELVDPNISNVHGALVSEVWSCLLGLHNLEDRHHSPARWYNLLTLLHSVTPQRSRIFEYFLPCNFAVSILGLPYTRSNKNPSV